jgi:hypothetical protein
LILLLWLVLIVIFPPLVFVWAGLVVWCVVSGAIAGWREASR